jgi:hypothetical protein
MNGVEFHYYSFTIDGYRRIRGEHGFTLVDFHTDDGKNGYYLARKAVGQHRSEPGALPRLTRGTAVRLAPRLPAPAGGRA